VDHGRGVRSGRWHRDRRSRGAQPEGSPAGGRGARGVAGGRTPRQLHLPSTSQACQWEVSGGPPLKCDPYEGRRCPCIRMKATIRTAPPAWRFAAAPIWHAAQLSVVPHLTSPPHTHTKLDALGEVAAVAPELGALVRGGVRDGLVEEGGVVRDDNGCDVREAVEVVNLRAGLRRVLLATSRLTSSSPWAHPLLLDGCQPHRVVRPAVSHRQRHPSSIHSPPLHRTTRPTLCLNLTFSSLTRTPSSLLLTAKRAAPDTPPASQPHTCALSDALPHPHPISHDS